MVEMSMMSMTFFTSTTSSLYSSSWTPNSAGQYAGTCIFLIVFAVLFRGLLAVRLNIFDVVSAIKLRRSDGFIHQEAYAFDCKQPTRRTWRVNEALMLAALDVLIAGIGYLLFVKPGLIEELLTMTG
jgi:copper transporter 1